MELAGIGVEWSNKSSRKNAFCVTASNGHQVLLQDDDPMLCKEWLEAIKSAAGRLPVKLLSDSSKNAKENLNIPKDHSLDKKDSLDLTPPSKAKLKRSKSQKIRSGSDSSSPGPAKAGSSQEDLLAPLPPERRKKITERLRQFLRRRPTLESLREKGIFKDEPVFGCHLANLCARDKSTVPKFVGFTIDAIEKKDLKSDGIYRVCGNLSQVQRIRFQVNQGKIFVKSRYLLTIV